MIIHHRVNGSGPGLVLLHAGACDSRMWDAQRDELASDYTVVTSDFRGHGETPLAPGTYSDAGDVLGLLDHLRIKEVALVGSSYGGGVALQIASAVPDLITSLVLLSPAAADGVERTEDLQAFIDQENALLEADDIDAATELNVRTWLGPAADEGTRQLVREMQHRAFHLQLAAAPAVEAEALPVDLAVITAPTTVVSGGHDLDFFRVAARQLSAELPNARHLELSWAGHLPNLERPAEITELIRAHLER